MIVNEDGEEVPAEDEEEEPEPDSEEAEAAEGEELELKKEKNYDNYETDHIFPDSCIKLDEDAEKLKERVKELPEDKVAGTHWNDADMDRRIKAYKDLNDSETGEPSLKDFYTKYNVDVFESNGEDALEAYKIYIERNGKPFNYMTFDSDAEAERLRQVEAEEEKNAQTGS